MTKEDLEKLTNGMQEKLGQEQASIIADDIATLLADNKNMLDTIKNKDTQINKLNTDKEKLINANSNLMLKIATGLEEPINNTKDKQQKEYKMLDSFDSKGNFK